MDSEGQGCNPSFAAADTTMTNPAPPHRRTALQLVLWLLLTTAAAAQQLAFAGLRTAGQQGQFNAVQADASGNLYLLLDQKDGVRLLKTDNAAQTVLAQTQLGAAGDIGLALALDPSGNVYVTGTTTSATLTATPGAAIATRADSSTNTFIARFDPSLNLVFTTLAGGSRIVPTGIAATADAVFITGFTYGANLPVTASAILQSPAYGSSQNGFVERFNSSGTKLTYATYLTGANGDTAPAAIAADTSDNAYIAGSTSASGYPTVAAVVPAMLGSTSGFLTKLTPAGDGIALSTFIPGAGITSVALAADAQSLLISGSIALGQFPVDTVTNPILPTTYQVVARLSLDGATVLSSTAVAPGTQSYLAPAPDGTAWIGGAFTAPLLSIAAVGDIGQAYLAHLNAQNKVDQTARFGGLPNGNLSFASLPIAVTALAVDSAGEPILAGGVQPTTGASLLASETYDLPLLNYGGTALSATLRSAIPATASCNGSLCPGYAAYLAKLAPAGTSPALAVSADAAPLVTLRNLGPTAATGLQISPTGPTVVGTNCAATLAPGAECNLLLTPTAGTLTISATNAATETVAIPATTTPASTVLFTPREIDFGIQSSTSLAAARIVTVTNLGLQSQTFPSNLDSSARSSPFTQTATDCTLAGAGTYTLAPGGACHFTLAFTALSASASDGFQQAQWLIGARDVVLTGYSQAAALSVSATEIDFGTQIAGGLRLPRYLYLSNSSTASVAHAAVTLPGSSPFTVADACPSTLAPASVCRIQLNYLSTAATSSDSVTLSLDQGLSVLVTGKTLPAQLATGSSVNPNLTVTPAAIPFTNAVPVTGVSSETHTVTIGNTGASAFTLNLALTGDFTFSTGCGTTLAGGATCTVVLTFAPGQPGTRDGLLAVTAGANTSPAYTSLTGTATAILPANNGSLTFPAEPVGQPAVQWYKVSQPFTTLAAAATGPFAVLLAEDTGYGHGQPASTAFTATASGSCLNCYLGVQFIPTATGAQTGTLTLTSAANGNPYILTLNGTGTPTTGLILTPLAQDFGLVPVHSQSGPMLFQLTNATASDLTVNAPAITGDFAQGVTPTGGQSCAGTLPASATCTVQLAFAPTATGARSGSLTLATTAGTVSAALTGYGSADPGISFSPIALTFLNVPGPTATLQTITVGNTGTASVQIGVPATSAAGFTVTSGCAMLAAGATCTLQVAYTPSTATATGTLQIPVTTASGTTDYAIPLTGAYTSENAGLQIFPSQMQFGPQAIAAQSLARQITVNNLTARSLTLNIALPRQFVLAGPPCSGLAPNAACTFSVAFLPLTNGDIPGTIFAQGTPTDGSATLNGTGYVEGYGLGAAALTLSGGLQPGNLLNFGQVVSGQSLTKTVTFTNSSATPLTVRRVTSQAPFFATTTCGATLTQGQSCAAAIAYNPINQVAAGAISPTSTNDAGALVIESDAASSPDTVILTGTALPTAVASPANTTPLATFAVSQSSLTFAATQVGATSATQIVTLANTGTATLHITGVTATADFTLQSTCATLVPGSSCAIAAAFAPQSTGAKAASIEISNDSVTPLEFVSLFGSATPSSLTLTPTALSFGLVSVGQSGTLPIQVSNTGTATVTFGAISVTGDYAVASGCPKALAPTATCTLQITFSPTAAGVRAGLLSLASSATGLPLTASLTGTGGQPHLVVAPTALAFGSITLGASTSLSLTLTNTGAVPLTGIALAIAGDFSIATPCGSTALAAGATCTIQVNFTPTAAGLRAGNLTIVSSDANSPSVVSLTGTAVPLGSFTLTVDGGSTSSAAVTSGNPATYQLALTPTGGFTGPVALTCAPLSSVQYASCSLLPSSLTLAATAQNSVATINTITEVAANSPQRGRDIFLCLLAPCFIFLWRRRKTHSTLGLTLWTVLSAAVLLSLGGCGGGSPANTHLRYTPAGSYQFQIAASSTTGPAISQTVKVTLVVQ